MNINENTIKIIKSYFKNYSKHGICNAINKFLKNNIEIKTYLEDYLNKNENWENIRNIMEYVLIKN